MFKRLLFPLLFVAAPPATCTVLLAANSDDFRRLAENILPKPIAEKITEYLKEFTNTNGKVDEEDILKYLNDEFTDDVYKQDHASDTNYKRHNTVNLKDLIGQFKGIISAFFDGNDQGHSVDTNDKTSHKDNDDKYDRTDYKKESKKPKAKHYDDETKNYKESRENIKHRYEQGQNGVSQSKKYFKYYTTRSARTTKSFRDEFKKSEDDGKIDVSYDKVELGKNSYEREKESYENDKRFTRIFEEDDYYQNNGIKTNKGRGTIKYDSDELVNKYGKGSNERSSEDHPQRFKEVYTTKSVLNYDPDKEILEPFTPYKSKYKSTYDNTYKYTTESNDEINKYETNEEEKVYGSNKKKTRFQIDHGQPKDMVRSKPENIGDDKSNHQIDRMNIERENEEFRDRQRHVTESDKSNVNMHIGRVVKKDLQTESNHNTQHLDREQSEGHERPREPESETELVLEEREIMKSESPERYHENYGIGQTIRDIEAGPMKKIIGTKIPKRQRFTISTPDYYNKQLNLAVPLNENEDLPQADREAERFPKERPYLTGIINGKKQKVPQKTKSRYLNMERQPK